MAKNTIVVVAEVLTILALILAGLFNFGGLSVKSELDDRYLALVCSNDVYHRLLSAHSLSPDRCI